MTVFPVNRKMSIFLIVYLVLGVIVLQAAVMSSTEQYRALMEEKNRLDVEARTRLNEAIRLVEVDKDLMIYKEFLKLHHESGLEKYLLKFTGTVTQKVNVTFGQKRLVVHLRGVNESMDVYASFQDKIPTAIKVGDTVTVSGMFVSGTLTSVNLEKSSAVLKD